MARFIYGMAQSLDGFVADSEGNITLPPPGEALLRHFNEIQRTVAASLYGRRMYEVMRYWEAPGEATQGQYELEFAKFWQETPKVVVSTTLTEVGPNARIIGTNVEAELRALKADTEGTIDVAGPTLAATLARLGLIDEYQLYLYPRVSGGGLGYFAPGLDLKLRFLGEEAMPDDVRLLRYAPA